MCVSRMVVEVVMSLDLLLLIFRNLLYFTNVPTNKPTAS